MKQRTTVDAMLADYLDGPLVLAKGTRENYRIYRNHVSAVFGLARPEDIKQSDIVRYLREAAKKCRSARAEIGLLSRAYGAWLEEGRLDFNPCFGVKVRLPASRRTRLITDAEIDAVIAQSGERLAVAIELAYATGLRIGDLCRLQWTDFHESVHTQKTGARQAFEVTEVLRALLDRARAQQARVASLYVLCDRQGAPLRKRTLWRWWVKACQRAGVEDAHFHDLRAAGGTEVEKRFGKKVAQSFLGHASERSTDVYLRGRRVNVVVPLARKKVS